MLRGKVTCIIFDVDGTLSEDVSWLKITAGLGASSGKHSEIFENFKKGKLAYPEAKGQLIQLWQNTSNANKRYMDNMFRSWKLKKDASETIAYLQKDYRVCLMSGAVDLYVQIVAEKLKVPDWYANTELVWDKDGKLVDFHYFADQSQKKLEQFEKFITENNINKTDCAIVGDGDSDIELFKELDCAIAVNKDPYPELEALAYKAITNLSELRQIF